MSAASEHSQLLDDKFLMRIAKKIGTTQMSLGIELGLELNDIEIIQSDHIGRHIDATMKILTVMIFLC